jgi:hypothetical protein
VNGREKRGKRAVDAADGCSWSLNMFSCGHVPNVLQKGNGGHS